MGWLGFCYALRYSFLYYPFPHFTDEKTEAQRGQSTCPRSHSRESNPGLNQNPNFSSSGNTAYHSGGSQSSQQASLQQHIPPTRVGHPGTSRHLGPDSTPPPWPRSPHAPRGSPASGPKPRPPGIEKRAPPSPRAPGHGPALPPHPARTAPPRGAARAPSAGPAGVCPAQGPHSGPHPPAAAPCPLPRARYPAHRLAEEPRPLPCPASVPSSSRSNRPTPPARAMTSHAPPRYAPT